MPLRRGTVAGEALPLASGLVARSRHADGALATWSTRKYMPFVMQRISIAVQLAAALEIRQALGMGLAPE